MGERRETGGHLVAQMGLPEACVSLVFQDTLTGPRVPPGSVKRQNLGKEFSRRNGDFGRVLTGPFFPRGYWWPITRCLVVWLRSRLKWGSAGFVSVHPNFPMGRRKACGSIWSGK